MNADAFYLLALLSLPAVLSVGASLCWPGAARLVGLARLGLHGGVIAAMAFFHGDGALFLPLAVGTLALPAAATPHYLALAAVTRTRATAVAALLGLVAGTCSLSGVGALWVAVNLVESWIGGGNDTSAPWMIAGLVAYGLGLLGEIPAAVLVGLCGIAPRLRAPPAAPKKHR